MTTKYKTWQDVAEDLLDNKEVILYFNFNCHGEIDRSDVFKVKFIKDDVREFGVYCDVPDLS